VGQEGHQKIDLCKTIISLDMFQYNKLIIEIH